MIFAAGQEAAYPDGVEDNTHYNVYGATTVAKLLSDALFTEVPVWQRSKGVPVVTVDLEVTHCSAAEAGLMLLLLKELWLGNLPLGGGKSIGRGTLRGIQASIYFDKKSWQIQDDRNLFAVEGDRNMLESYVTALAGEMNG